ncbi:MAG TPA: glycosyltransferase family A protein [Acidimicrobiales bacterium]|nr:glycosyltransferase family A protein [Acidimicrobiales bacterium]
MREPLVSVVIPVYNAVAFVQPAIKSILSQCHRRLEVIVVDDESSDGSVAAVRAIADARIRVFEQQHAGAAAARNRGVSEANGELLAFLDADDEWTEGKLRRQIAALRSDPTLDMVYGRAVAVRGRRAGPPVDGFCLGTLLGRAEAVRRVGPFATSWRAGEFLDWFARAQDLGVRHGLIRTVVLRRRIHVDNLTRDRSALVDYARVLRTVVERRSASQGAK